MVKERHRKTLRKAEEEKVIDKEMIGLCDFIADSKHYFTSSGCSGRILLLKQLDRTKKNSFFHKKWHGTASFSQILESINEETEGELWLKVEPFIIHIGADTLANARKVLALKDKTGIKRGGIIVAKDGKFIIELIGTDEFALPVKRNNKVLVTEEFLKEIVEEANIKIKRNYIKVAEFEQTVRKELK